MANDRRRRSPNDRPRWLPNQQASQREDDRKYLLFPIGALEIEDLLLLLHDPAVLGEDTVGEPDDERPEQVDEAWEPAPCEHLNGGLSGFKNRCGGCTGGPAFILSGHDETPDEARARYFSENPEKRNARLVYLNLMMETSFEVRR